MCLEISTLLSFTSPTLKGSPAIILAAKKDQSKSAPLWLEEVEGDKALAKVNEWNKGTLDKLKSDERYNKYYDAGLEIVNATDKIPYGSYRGGFVYNFWQDENQVRGTLRRTSLEEYSNPNPKWQTLLSIDSLSETEQKNWVYKE